MRITEAMMIASAIEVNNLQFGAIQTLIEAAKKQEPMKPEWHLVPMSGFLSSEPQFYKVCGNCKELIVDQSYCENCGQRVDWTED